MTRSVSSIYMHMHMYIDIALNTAWQVTPSTHRGCLRFRFRVLQEEWYVHAGML